MNMFPIAVCILVVMGFFAYKLYVYISKKEELELQKSIIKIINNKISKRTDPFFVTTKEVREWILHEAIVKEVQVKIISHNCFDEIQISGNYATSSFYHVPFYSPSRKMSDTNEIDVSERNDASQMVRLAQAYAVIYAAHYQMDKERDLTREDLEHIKLEVNQIYGDVVDTCVFNVGQAHAIMRITDRDNYELSVEQLFPSTK